RSCYLRAWVAGGNSQRVRSAARVPGKQTYEVVELQEEKEFPRMTLRFIVWKHHEKSSPNLRFSFIFQRSNWKF
ncbi:hypothetical protein, partial [Paenibacillus piri]|uniref:hypothetical protein n=1 Tax=Paenibacillus piri TaxID=2547395 RepID=UPI001C709C47